MATSTAVHSTAFNFLSFMQSGVDPRTGQYTVRLALPEIKANGLSGPAFPLSLNFNPLNLGNTGIARGWQLPLTEFDADKQIIALASGETFKVTGMSSIGNRLEMAEQKIQSFYLYRDEPTLYRVVHASGIIEMLRLEGKLALPETIYSAEGFKVSFGYTPFSDGVRRLHTVTDGYGVRLLEINRPANAQAIEILLRPDGTPGGALARFEMKLRDSGPGEEVYEVVLPTDDLDRWQFTYRTVNGLLCITDVRTPVGAHETIEYSGIGHAFPGFAKPPLPRVWKHIVEPGFQQPPIEVHYGYDTEALPGSNNFLGNNARISWVDNGLDNLYQDNSRYQYGTTERHFAGGVEVRRIERTFNRFHLISEEKTTQGNNVQQVFTTYYADVDLDQPFANQPPQCQLPRSVETRWSLKNGAVPARSQSVSSRYDTHGNLTEQIQANGIKEAYEYFPAGGIPGECPADPQGFVRNLRQMTVTPATGRESGAPVLRTRQKYAVMDPLQGSSERWLALTDETLYKVNGTQETELRHTAYKTSDTPTNPLLHGRRVQQAVTLNDLTTTTDYAYKTLNSTFVGETVLQITETLKGHDHGDGDTFTLKQVIVEHSLLHGEQLLARDDNDMEVRTTYDALLRMTSETVAPGTDYVATRRYRYFLAGSGDGQASQEVTDVKGVKTRTLFDGLNRPIAEQRQDKDHQSGAKAEAFRDTYKARYDALGQLEEEIEYDWRTANPADDLVLVSRYRYDDWSAQSSMIRADGVEEHEVTDPIKQTVTAWIDGLGKTVTHVNLFDKPERIQRYQLNDDPTDPQTKPYSEHTYHYDGLGRTAHEFDALRHKTAYVYDAFGRMHKTTLPNNDVMQRSYALHSSEELPVRLLLTPVDAGRPAIEAGLQSYDGLGRVTQVRVGPRTERYLYEGSQMRVSKRKTPAGEDIQYRYAPGLPEQPVQIIPVENNQAATFDYDLQSALLNFSDNGHGRQEFDYDSAGNLKAHRRIFDGTTWTARYNHSLSGRQLARTDVNDVDSFYTYGQLTGRLETLCQGNVQAGFEYYPNGFLWRTTVEDTVAKTTLVTEFGYDDQGREILRTLSLSGQPVCTISQTWRTDDRLHTRHRQAGAQSRLLEEFNYDTRGRLELYVCSGDDLPADRYGNKIIQQLFRFDVMDNVDLCRTCFADGTQDNALFTYGAADPCQLHSVTHDHPTYPQGIVTFKYNPNGNMLNDEQGNQLRYDSQGRLSEVISPKTRTITEYRYDGHNHLFGVKKSGEPQTLRFYQNNRLSNTVKDDTHVQYLYHNDQPLSQQQANDPARTLLLMTDSKGSVIGESQQDDLRTAVYNAYGERSSEHPIASELAFNGELREQTGWYLLGRGYRAYDPSLKRFHSPDLMAFSPFGVGGINPYKYCGGDPVNFSDPNGHFFSFGDMGTDLMAFGLFDVLQGVASGNPFSIVFGLVAIVAGASVSSNETTDSEKAFSAKVGTYAGLAGMFGSFARGGKKTVQNIVNDGDHFTTNIIIPRRASAPAIMGDARRGSAPAVMGATPRRGSAPAVMGATPRRGSAPNLGVGTSNINSRRTSFMDIGIQTDRGQDAFTQTVGLQKARAQLDVPTQAAPESPLIDVRNQIDVQQHVESAGPSTVFESQVTVVSRNVDTFDPSRELLKFYANVRGLREATLLNGQTRHLAPRLRFP